jgi:hypothetical protein
MRPLSSSFASAIIVHRGVPATSPLRRVFAVSLLFFSFLFFFLSSSSSSSSSHT